MSLELVNRYEAVFLDRGNNKPVAVMRGRYGMHIVQLAAHRPTDPVLQRCRTCTSHWYSRLALAVLSVGFLKLPPALNLTRLPDQW